MAINIPSLFRDVIETPEQRQRRKLSEAVALAPQTRGGIASLLNPLAQAASINLQQGSEGLGRSVGGMLGLDMRDTSEKVSDQLLGADLSSPQGMRDLSVALRGIAPLQSIGLIEAAEEKERLNRAEQMAEQDFAMRQAQAAENIFDSVFRRDLAERAADINANEDQRKQAEFLVNQQFNVLRISELADQLVRNRKYQTNLEEAGDDIASLGVGYEAIGNLVKNEMLSPSDAIQGVWQQEANRYALSQYKALPKARAENIYALAKESEGLKDVLSRGFFGRDPEMSEAKFNNYASVIASAYPSMDDEGIIKIIEAQQNLAVLEPLAQANTESIAQEMADQEVTPDEMEAAASDLAKQGEGGQISEKAPVRLSQSEINEIGFIPAGYRKMTSGDYVLSGESKDWQGESFRTPNRNEALVSFRPEIQNEYNRLKQSGKTGTDVKIFNEAIDNILNKKYPQ